MAAAAAVGAAPIAQGRGIVAPLGFASVDGSTLVVWIPVPEAQRARVPRHLESACFAVNSAGALTHVPSESFSHTAALAGHDLVFCGDEGLFSTRAMAPVRAQGGRLPNRTCVLSDCGRFCAGYASLGADLVLLIARLEWNAARTEVRVRKLFQAEEETSESALAFAPQPEGKRDAEPLLARAVLSEGGVGVALLRPNGTRVRLLEPASRAATGEVTRLTWTRPAGAFLIAETTGGVLAWRAATGECVADFASKPAQPLPEVDAARARLWLSLRSLRVSSSGKVAAVVDDATRRPLLLDVGDLEDPAQWRPRALVDTAPCWFVMSPAGDSLAVAEQVDTQGGTQLRRVKLA
jgi:hypothetical protein